MSYLQKTFRFLAALILVGLAACAAQPPAPAPEEPISYVVLLEDEDGSFGKVLVSGLDGSTLLEKPREATFIGDPAGKVFNVGDAQLARDFGAALVAAPLKPVSFMLYFETGGAKLTARSEADLPRILAEAAKRPAPDLSVIGHTDTVGDDDSNEKLALKRAQFVANLITAKVKAVQISVESHGEKNLLVPTPDNTPEPRNRRVEVTVR